MKEKTLKDAYTRTSKKRSFSEDLFKNDQKVTKEYRYIKEMKKLRVEILKLEEKIDFLHSDYVKYNDIFFDENEDEKGNRMFSQGYEELEGHIDALI